MSGGAVFAAKANGPSRADKPCRVGVRAVFASGGKGEGKTRLPSRMRPRPSLRIPFRIAEAGLNAMVMPIL